MVLVAFLTPLAVVSPLAGVYVDSGIVKATMIASDLIRAAHGAGPGLCPRPER